MREIITRNEGETESFALGLSEALRPGDVIALVGDLGSGKTTLTKYIAKGLGVTEVVTSPTFTIVNEYTSGRLPLYHFDAYRLRDEEDAFDIGMEEYFDKGGVCIIEWADLIEGILPDDVKCILAEYGDEEGERVYKCTF